MVKGNSKSKAPSAAAAAKKVYVFKKPTAGGPSSSSSSAWKAGRRRSFKESKATFSLVAAKYQKGELEGQLTGNIYMRAKPRYAANDEFKETLAKVLLAEPLRWNTELKLYTAKVYNAVQARLALTTMRKLVGGDEDLPEDIDETVFETANTYHIDIVPMTVGEGPTSQNENVIAVGGATYAFNAYLKDKGFIFQSNVNGIEDAKFWLAPAEDVEVDELVAHFEQFGFPVDVYDEAAQPDDVTDA